MLPCHTVLTQQKPATNSQAGHLKTLLHDRTPVFVWLDHDHPAAVEAALAETAKAAAAKAAKAAAKASLVDPPEAETDVSGEGDVPPPPLFPLTPRVAAAAEASAVGSTTDTRDTEAGERPGSPSSLPGETDDAVWENATSTTSTPASSTAPTEKVQPPSLSTSTCDSPEHGELEAGATAGAGAGKGERGLELAGKIAKNAGELTKSAGERANVSAVESVPRAQETPAHTTPSWGKMRKVKGVIVRPMFDHFKQADLKMSDIQYKVRCVAGDRRGEGVYEVCWRVCFVLSFMCKRVTVGTLWTPLWVNVTNRLVFLRATG